MITFIRPQGWHLICALKPNRVLRRPGQPGQPRVVKRQIRPWAKGLRYTPYTRVGVKAAEETVTTYLVRSLRGRLNRVPFDLCVLISKGTRRDKHPAYLKEALGLADYQMQKLEAIASGCDATRVGFAKVQHLPCRDRAGAGASRSPGAHPPRQGRGRRESPAGAVRWQGGAQRPVSVWQRQEVQALPHVARHAGGCRGDGWEELEESP